MPGSGVRADVAAPEVRGAGVSHARLAVLRGGRAARVILSDHGAGFRAIILLVNRMFRSRRLCRYPGCAGFALKGHRYCQAHAAEELAELRAQEAARDRRRGSARQRGYDARWNCYSKWFLSLPGNQLCALRLDEGCAVVAQCVDHIDPPDGPDDPRFWDFKNHQPSCIHCNSVKGHRFMRKI